MLIRHLWQLKTDVFLQWCLICTVLFLKQKIKNICIFQFLDVEHIYLYVLHIMKLKIRNIFNCLFYNFINELMTFFYLSDGYLRDKINYCTFVSQNSLSKMRQISCHPNETLCSTKLMAMVPTDMNKNI
jgi:hypothetical protein